MTADKSSLSQAKSYQEIGEFWDTHDLGEFWDETTPAEFEVDLRSDVTYYALEPNLSMKLHILAGQRGISAETLLNLWVQEKATEAMAAD